MAINVNTVYTTVLSILNKEQRGYLTPYEFNQLATQVQLEIFEKFFEDYNQYVRMPKTDVEFASRMDHIMEEFQVFEENKHASGTNGVNEYEEPVDLHRFGSVTWNLGKNSPSIEILSNRDYNEIKLSPLTQPSNDFPVAKYRNNKIIVYPIPDVIDKKDVNFNYIRKPKDPVWAYKPNPALAGAFIFNDSDPVDPGVIPSTGFQDFEISDSQQTEVIINILKYAGVIIRDPQIVQSASQLAAAQDANTKR